MTGINKCFVRRIPGMILAIMAVIMGIVIGGGYFNQLIMTEPVRVYAAQETDGADKADALSGISENTSNTGEDITEADGHRIIYYDKAQIVEASGKADVIEAMKAISADSNVIFYTTDRNEADETADVCANVCASYFGSKKTAPVVMFTIDMYHREIYMYCTGAVHKIIRSRDALAITDNIYKLASKEQYAQCAVQAFNQAQRRINGLSIKRPMQIVTNALLAVMIGFLTNYIFLLVSRKANGAHKDAVRSAYGDNNSMTIDIKKKCIRKYSYRYSEGSSDSSGGFGGFDGGGGGDSGGSSGGGHSF